MAESTTGTHSGITIKGEDSYGEKVAKGIPVVGGLVKAGMNTSSAMSDGQLGLGEVRTLALDGANFVQSCRDAATGIASDPIGWLVGQGLNFLITVVQPLQDAIHFVSGDGPALATAGGNFNSIGQGLVKFADKFAEQARTALPQWSGEAKDAAQRKLDEFVVGIRGTAGQAGDIAQLLQISSMVMTVIEEFIKALVTEFVSWLVMIWIPALAAAVPSFGSSVAAAWSGTAVKGTQTGVKATKQVSRLRRLLDMVRELLEKLKALFARTREFFKLTGEAARTAGQRASGHAGMRTALLRQEKRDKLLADGRITEPDAGGVLTRSLVEKGRSNLKDQVSKPNKVGGHVNNAAKSAEYGSTGDDQSPEETRDHLDL